MDQLKSLWAHTRHGWLWLMSHGYHLLFGISILALAALIAWWSVFILNAVKQQHSYQYESMMSSAKALALLMGHNPQAHPALGTMSADDRLEIVALASADPDNSVVLNPYWSNYSIRPRTAYVKQIEQKYQRQLVMVFGESSVLVLIIIISSLMLYRLMWLERRSSRELREFWSRITHELKTPITGVKAFLQTLALQEFSREQLEPLVEMALREVERQEILAENLLIGQRMGKGSLGLQMRPFALAQRVGEFVAEHQVLNPHGTLRLAITSGEISKVLADSDVLWMILENLTDNALKYGGTNPQITYEVSFSIDRGQVTVSDQGEGFEPQFAERIFQAYCRLTEELPRGRHGTGMGLYISRQLARKMRGDLRAESAGRGQGAKFILTLRRA